MAQTIYSTRFMAIGGAILGNYTFTVPPGLIAIVRDLDAVLDLPSSAGSVSLGISGVFWGGSPPLPFRFSSWSGRGRNVGAAGEVIDVGVGLNGVSFCVSGYLLTP